MNWHSVRVRLTLWNVLVLACVLSGFGAAMAYTVQANQAAAIDRQLAEQARGIGPRMNRGRGFRRELFIRRGASNESSAPRPAQPAPGPDPGPPPGGPPPWEQGPERRPFGEPGRPFRQPITRQPGDVGPAPMLVNGQPVLEFRRPLFLTREGNGFGMFSDDRPWDPAHFQRSLRGDSLYSTITVNGERVRVFSAPMRLPDGQEGVVQAAHPLGEQQRLADSQFRTLLLLIPLALLVAGGGGLFLTNRALRPVRDVTQAAAEIGAGDLSRRLKVTGKDELAELSVTFNGMIARLQETFGGLEHANAELAQAYSRLERAFEEQRRFTGDASHELRTPLTRIKGSTSLALCGPHDADSYREALEVADEAADTMARIVQDLLLLARSDAGQLPVRLSPISIEDVLHRSLAGLRDQPGAAIRLEIPPGNTRVLGDLDHLARLFSNLLENALRHTPRDGAITVSARPRGDVLEVTVRDTGEGIPPEHLPHVCERFYRVDQARTGGRGGTGLGLAICQSIVQAHGGTLTLRSRPGHGTAVTVTLPLAPTPALAATA